MSLDLLSTSKDSFVYFTSYIELYNYKKLIQKLDLVRIQNFKNHSKKFKTLVCHDMQNGYLNFDRVEGASLSCNQSFYTFFHWWNIDIFVYFSHNFITIPPIVWTNQAHRHGVVMLGTFITENKGGFDLCEKIFSSLDEVNKLVSQLVQLCIDYGFDGWLINIENNIKKEHLEYLAFFLKSLRVKLHEAIGEHFYVIWYDSVIETGKVKYQNELNSTNLNWFQSVSAIFLNYSWNLKNLILSFLAAGERNYEVFVGVDVFGRNCYGNGGWNCNMAMEIIKNNKLSIAIFAPGWISEKFSKELFFTNSFKFWNSISKFVTTNRKLKELFSTNFCIGFDCEKKWFTMNKAQLQPFYLSTSKQNAIIASNNGLWIHSDDEETLFICDIKLFKSLDVLIKTSESAILNIHLSNKSIVKVNSEAGILIIGKIPSNQNVVITKITIIKNEVVPFKISYLSLKEQQ